MNNTINPKGILVIGHTKELMGERSKIETFELFRRDINNLEIITFDELYERAKFIVDQVNEDLPQNDEEKRLLHEFFLKTEKIMPGTGGRGVPGMIECHKKCKPHSYSRRRDAH